MKQRPGSLRIRIAASLLAWCCSGTAQAAAADWKTPLMREHPLVGRVWDVRAGHEVTRDTMLARLAQARIVLLGETHDNEDHHRLQAQTYVALTAGGSRPALVMEQFDTENQAAIDTARGAADVTARSLAGAGRMRDGWNLDFYAPLIARALEVGAPVAAANLSREAARGVMREGFAALGSERERRLGLAQVWNADREAVLRRDIVDSHCGQVPDGLLTGLVAAQRARDAVMADVLLDHAQRGAVGIVGTGHARRDRGVPRYLEQRRPDLEVAAVALIEVEADRLQATDFVVENPNFDFLWFTPRAQRRDPCEGFSLPAAR